MWQKQNQRKVILLFLRSALRCNANFFQLFSLKQVSRFNVFPLNISTFCATMISNFSLHRKRQTVSHKSFFHKFLSKLKNCILISIENTSVFAMECFMKDKIFNENLIWSFHACQTKDLNKFKNVFFK